MCFNGWRRLEGHPAWPPALIGSIWRWIGADSFVGHCTPAGPRFAVEHDREEQLLERCGRMFDADQLGMVSRDDLLDLVNALIRQASRPNLRDVGLSEQRIDTA